MPSAGGIISFRQTAAPGRNGPRGSTKIGRDRLMIGFMIGLVIGLDRSNGTIMSGHVRSCHVFFILGNCSFDASYAG